MRVVGGGVVAAVVCWVGFDNVIVNGDVDVNGNVLLLACWCCWVDGAVCYCCCVVMLFACVGGAVVLVLCVCVLSVLLVCLCCCGYIVVVFL